MPDKRQARPPFATTDDRASADCNQTNVYGELYATGVDFADVPAELTAIDRWINWRAETKPEGTFSKIPLGDGQKPSNALDSRNWINFDGAVARYQCDTIFSGIGFVLDGDGIVGIDVDNVRAGDGEIKTWAAEVVEHVPTYWEVSPSGRGLRAFVRIDGRWRGPKRCGGIEVYDDKRFLTVTGQRTATSSTELLSGADAANALDWLRRGPLAVAEMRMRDPQAGRLWSGDRSGYRSPSEADFALAKRLAFYMAGDGRRIEAAMRASRLYRPKWDEPRNGERYLDIVIEKALQIWRLELAAREADRLAGPRMLLRSRGLKATNGRIRVIEELMATGGQPLPGEDLARRLGKGFGALRSMMTSLRSAGLVRTEVGGYTLAGLRTPPVLSSSNDTPTYTFGMQAD